MNKTAKILAKALSNPSQEESMTAFRMAFNSAKREGIQLSSIQVIKEEPSISNKREKELVDKYNKLLDRAKTLKAQVNDLNEMLKEASIDYLELLEKIEDNKKN